MKDKNHMITPIKTEKSCDKIQYHFIIRTSLAQQKRSIKTAQLVLSLMVKMECFLPKITIKTEMSLLSTSI